MNFMVQTLRKFLIVFVMTPKTGFEAEDFCPSSNAP